MRPPCAFWAARVVYYAHGVLACLRVANVLGVEESVMKIVGFPKKSLAVLVAVALAFWAFPFSVFAPQTANMAYAASSIRDMSTCIPDKKLCQVLQILANYQNKKHADFYSLLSEADADKTDITALPEAAAYNTTVSQDVLESYTGSINLAPYTGISSLEGLNYAKKATKVVLPNNATAIAGKTFYEMTGLESVVMPKTVTAIGDSAFEKCESLVNIGLSATSSTQSDKVLHLENVTDIGISAFASCLDVKAVAFSSSKAAVNIRSGAFA